MTQEQKDLLLKGLCARLPYGVIVSTDKGKGHVCNINLTIFDIEIGVNINPIVRDTFSINNVKPYLFPISSMTEEEQKKYRKICDLDMEILKNRPMKGEPFPALYNSQDWLDAHHFDYRDLISKGLAIDATSKNIY